MRDFRASPAGAALPAPGAAPEDYARLPQSAQAPAQQSAADVEDASMRNVSLPPPAEDPPPATQAQQGDPFVAQHIGTPPMPRPDPMMRQGLSEQIEGSKRLGDDSARMYANQAQAAEQARQKAEAFEGERQAQVTQRAAQFETERQGILAAKVDPNRYWNSKTTGQQAGSVIGMILGGIGSGLTGGPNLAVQMLDHATSRDIAAQEHNLNTRKTMLGEYLAQTRDLASAKQLTYAHMMNSNAARMEQMALASGSQKAKDIATLEGGKLKVAASQALMGGVTAQMQQQNMQLDRQLKTNSLNLMMDSQKAAQAIASGGRRGAPAGANGAAGDLGIYLSPQAAASPALDPLLPSLVKVKSDSSGDQYRKLVDPKTREKVMEKLQAADQVESGVRRLAQIAAAHPNGTWSPEANQEARSLSGVIKVGFFNSEEDQKRFTDNEKKIIDDAMADPSSFWQSAFGGNTGRLNAIQRIMHTHRASVLNNYTLGKPIPMTLPGDR